MTAYDASQVCLVGLVLVAARVHTRSTSWTFSFTPEYICYVPGAMLYDDACTVLLYCVFGDALLQCVEFVGMGERSGRVVEKFEFGM